MIETLNALCDGARYKANGGRAAATLRAKVKREVKGKEKEKDKSRTEEQESSPKDFTHETSPAESRSYQTLSTPLQADLQIFA